MKKKTSLVFMWLMALVAFGPFFLAMGIAAYYSFR